MIEKGMFLRVRTRTLDDVFGEVIYEVVETGLKVRDKDREGAMDGVRCVMVSATGSSKSRPDIIDSEWQIERDIAAGVTKIISPAEGRQGEEQKHV